VQLYLPLAATGSCTRVQNLVEIECHTFENTNGLVQFHEEKLVVVKFSCLAHQRLSKFGEDVLDVCEVGSCQELPRDLSPESLSVSHWLDGSQARFDIAEVFAKGPLRKRHIEKLISPGENTRIAVVPTNAHTEVVSTDEVHELSEH
jgi:hypothetical protein